MIGKDQKVAILYASLNIFLLLLVSASLSYISSHESEIFHPTYSDLFRFSSTRSETHFILGGDQEIEISFDAKVWPFTLQKGKDPISVRRRTEPDY